MSIVNTLALESNRQIKINLKDFVPPRKKKKLKRSKRIDQQHTVFTCGGWRDEYIQHVVRKTCDHKKFPSQIKSDYPVIDTFIIQYINVYKKIKDINLRGRYTI